MTSSEPNGAAKAASGPVPRTAPDAAAAAAAAAFAPLRREPAPSATPAAPETPAPDTTAAATGSEEVERPDASAATEPVRALPAVIRPDRLLRDLARGSVSAVLDRLGAAAARWSPRHWRMPRPRLLPALIFVGVMLIGVRSGALWYDVQALSVSGSVSLAEEPAAPAVLPSGEPPSAAEAEAVGAPGADAGDATAAGASPADDVIDPQSMTRAELALLQDLAARREALDARERSLAEREALLSVAERRLEEKLTELRSTQDRIEDLLVDVDEQRAQQFENLVGIYEAMRPADAAAIFNGLDIDVLVSVLERMRKQKSGPILAGMEPDRARAVTAELALRRTAETISQ